MNVISKFKKIIDWEPEPFSKKEKVMIAILIVFAILLEFFWFYWTFLNDVFVTSEIIDNERYHFEKMNIDYKTPFNLPLRKEVKEQMNSLTQWKDSVETYLKEECVEPINLNLHCKLEHGKTTFWYDGIVNLKNGYSINYYKEKVLYNANFNVSINDDWSQYEGDIRLSDRYSMLPQ